MVSTKIEILQGDITKLPVDVIVNAANTTLLGGSGVDGAIHREGGKQILEECKQIAQRQGGCITGQAVYTTAGKLPAKYVIHTVGPVWRNGSLNEGRLLYSAYHTSLELAVSLGAKTIAFPNISTGVYGFPKQPAAEIALRTVNAFLQLNKQLEKVYFVCFDDENYTIYSNLIRLSQM